MITIGYIRVSTSAQELGLEAQIKTLTDYGVPEELIFEDRGVSGKVNAHSETMKKLLVFVGDQSEQVEVVVTKLDRWGRDPEDTVALMKVLAAEGGCLTSIAESVSRITPESGTGMLIIRIYLAIAAQERDRIAERTREALAAQRSRGVPLGPTPKLTSLDVEWIKEQRKEGLGAKRIAKKLYTDRNVKVGHELVMRVLGMGKNPKPYVPKDNHKYVQRAAEAAARKADDRE